MNPLQKPGRSLYFHANRHGICIAVFSKKQLINMGFRRNFLSLDPGVSYNRAIACDRNYAAALCGRWRSFDGKIYEQREKRKWQMITMGNAPTALARAR